MSSAERKPCPPGAPHARDTTASALDDAAPSHVVGNKLQAPIPFSSEHDGTPLPDRKVESDHKIESDQQQDNAASPPPPSRVRFGAVDVINMPAPSASSLDDTAQHESAEEQVDTDDGSDENSDDGEDSEEDGGEGDDDSGAGEDSDDGDDGDALTDAMPPFPKGLLSHLLQQGSLGSKPLHAAAAANDHQALAELLAPAADTHECIDDTDVFCYTPLHVAAEKGALEACNKLLELGANFEAYTKMHRSRPLHYASFEGHLEVCTALLTAGADINALTDDNRSALYQAAFRGHLDCVRVLLKAGADHSLTTNENKSAADVAATKEIRDLLEMPAQKKVKVLVS